MRKELGKWLMDIAKYLITGILLTSIFADMKTKEMLIYSLIISTVLLSIGMLQIYKAEKEEKKTSEHHNNNNKHGRKR